LKSHFVITGLTMLFGLVLPIAGVQAAFTCYSEKHLPAVFKLEETSEGIRIQLGGTYADLKKRVAPVLAYREGGGWSYVESRSCGTCEAGVHEGKCREPIPKWEALPPQERKCKPGENCRRGIPTISLATGEEIAPVIEETSSACDVRGKVVWFGINFYRGEGFSGYGGLGRYEQGTGRPEIRRLPELRNYPIHKVVSDGESLWAATTLNYECIGHPPALGLIRYKWNTQELTHYKGKNDGPCGFVIHDLLLRQGILWVATDIGLSRRDSKSGQWTHYLPDRKSPGKVAENRCEAIYKNLLDTLPRNEYCDESKSCYQMFYKSLKEFRPDFVNRLESKE
jgi:hypothetical protein